MLRLIRSINFVLPIFISHNVGFNKLKYRNGNIFINKTFFYNKFAFDKIYYKNIATETFVLIKNFFVKYFC